MPHMSALHVCHSAQLTGLTVDATAMQDTRKAMYDSSSPRSRIFLPLEEDMIPDMLPDSPQSPPDASPHKETVA